MEKLCGKCGQSKDLDMFHKNKNSKDGRVSRCKECAKQYWSEYYPKNEQKYRDRTKQWRIENPDAFQDQMLRSKYDLSYVQYQVMLIEQGAVCAICKKSETRNKKGKIYRLHVDHDHATGKVRRLLCHHCNAGIGHFQDDPVLLRAAADYLESDCKSK